ncbi:FecR family protein [Dysgonomonas sp. GY75]|uniref:FecR family protein n=1 Tax=Dysgonomonas sp. GY75 TaxID=2780419 RepID=UPI0018835FB2|nr:FecR domain-containing protein [Dysgonomonas sp. GY75]MBF0647383.1 FecR family protein [Dysgonomonas sp. GY75]
MRTKNHLKDYTKFTFEDFLQDVFFIESILNPTEESDSFWREFQNGNEENLTHFFKAISCIKDLNKDLLDDDSVRKIWNNIQKTNSKRTFRTKIAYITISSLVAASIALLIFFRFSSFSPTQDIEEQGIKSFAYENTLATSTTTEAQLILSDNKIIALSDQESVISYDSTSIKVNSQETLKKEKSAIFNQLIIPKGKRSFLTLSDGTRIWINSDTRVVFPAEFKGDKREIFVDGEIYIDVQPDKQKPFIVRTNDIDIKVLGTKFNVQAYSSDIQKRIVLKSGSIKLFSETNNKEILMQPNEMFELADGRGNITKVNADIYTSWIDGIYICENERLDVILTRISRYYGVEISVDKESAALKCFGKLDLKDNPDKVMEVIKYIAPVKCVYNNNKYIITYRF